MFFRGGSNIHIFANDTKRLAVTAGRKDTVCHFFCPAVHSMLTQGTLGNPNQIENISVLADQGTIRFLRLRGRFPDKAA